jgi:hypothetical protein
MALDKAWRTSEAPEMADGHWEDGHWEVVHAWSSEAGWDE